MPSFIFFFNDTATTEIYTLSLHDALPICWNWCSLTNSPTSFIWIRQRGRPSSFGEYSADFSSCPLFSFRSRSEEHTSELQSLAYLVCRLLLEKKKKKRCYSTGCTRHITHS